MYSTYKINPQKIRSYYGNPFIPSVPESYQKCTLDLQHNGIITDLSNKIKSEWSSEPIILLSEITGSGKTHIACASAKLYLFKKICQWIENKKEYDFGFKDYAQQDFDKYVSDNMPVFYNESDIYGMITGTYNNNSRNDEIDIIKYLGSNKRLIIIDDMFASRQNEFARSKMYDIINLRLCYNNLPTIITSNLTIDQIAVIDNRIASRLYGKFCFQIKNAEDFRKKN